MHIDQTSYRKAYLAFVRKGTPIKFEMKADRTSTHYIWRTRNDGKVRSAHAANDGQIFHGMTPHKPVTPERITIVGARQSPTFPKRMSFLICLSMEFPIQAALGAAMISFHTIINGMAVALHCVRRVILRMSRTHTFPKFQKGLKRKFRRRPDKIKMERSLTLFTIHIT